MIQFSWTLEVCKVFSSKKIFQRTLNRLEYCCKINKQTNKQKQDKTKQNKTLSVLIVKFVTSLCAFCKLRRNLSFFCSVHHLSGPLREHMFTCTSSKSHGLLFVIGVFRSVLIVSCFKVRCFVIVLFLALID